MQLPRQKFTNLALIAIAVALFGVVLWTRGGVTTGEQEARANNVLASWREDDLTSIEIEHDKGKLRIERRDTPDGGDPDWFLTSPLAEEADINAVTDLIGSLGFATPVRRIKPEEVDRGAFGLDAPSWVMRLELGRIHYRLALGKEAAAPPGARYLEVSGDGAPRPGVMIISRDLVKQLDVDADTLRTRQVFPYVSSALSRLQIEGAGGSRKLRRAEWGGWRFDGMENDVRVNREALDRILLQFARTQVEHFIDAALAERALAGATSVRVTMVHEDPKKPRAVIEVGGVCPKNENEVVALRREPERLAACAPKSVMPGLSTTTDELVDRSLFTLRTDEVEAFVSVEGDKRLELERKEKGFVMRAPQHGSIELEPGNQRIQSMISVRGELLPGKNPKELGLDPPRGSVLMKSTAALESRVVEESVAIGNAASDGRVNVRRKQDGALLLIDAASARSLLPDATLMRNRTIFDFSPTDLRTIEIKTPRTTQKLARSLSGSFTLEAPKGFDADPGLSSDLVEALRSLAAERWAADRDDGNFGLQKPGIQLSVAIEKRDSPRTERVVSIGTPTSGGAFASVQGEAGVFVMPRPALEAIDTLLIDRSSFVVGENEARRISITAEKTKVELVRQGNRLIPAEGGQELGEAQVQRIVDALGAMRPEAAIEIGPPKAEYGFTKPELLVRIEREPGLGERSKPLTYRIGAGDSWRRLSVHYARIEGLDATFVITRNKIRELLDGL
jgi:hypothetical protein